MKKILLIGVVLILLAACSQTPAEDSQTSVKVSTDTQGAQVTNVKVSSGAQETQIKTDLKEVFASKGEYKCSVSIEGPRGGEEIVYYKNGKVRTDVKTAAGEAHAIYGGDDLWSWTGVQCFHMNTKDSAKGLPGMESVQIQTKDELTQNAANVRCEPTSVPDGMFSPPADCKDLSEMLKQLQGIQGGSPY